MWFVAAWLREITESLKVNAIVCQPRIRRRGSPMFKHRGEAGKRLAAEVSAVQPPPDIVLAIPRGGVPVGRVVADRLGIPLDVVVASKIGAPSNPELAIGAVASDGTTWLNDDLIAQLAIDDTYVETQIEREGKVAAEKLHRYRGERPPISLGGRNVLIVDDGIATGATMFACLAQVYEAGAASVGVGIPVAPPDTLEVIRERVDWVVCVETPHDFGAVGRFYESFGQVSDEVAMSFLEQPD